MADLVICPHCLKPADQRDGASYRHEDPATRSVRWCHSKSMERRLRFQEDHATLDEVRKSRDQAELWSRMLSWVLKEQEAGRSPTSVDVAKAFEMTPDEVEKIRVELEKRGEFE